MDRKKPLIGILPLYDEKRESVWILPGYTDLIRMAGGVPLLLPYDMTMEEFAGIRELFSGFLFTGGNDVDPHMYREEKRRECHPVNPVRDREEAMVFDFAYENDVPVFGICRGCQMINVLMGGTLYQDLPSEHPSGVQHHMEAPYDRPAHEVVIFPDTPLSGTAGEDRKAVNSCHHQGIRTLGEGVLPMAAAEDGITEAIYLPGRRFAAAVQWHPEFIYRKDPWQVRILRAFAEAAENRGK